MSAFLVFQDWRESQGTQVLLEVLVFQVWMAVMEPEVPEELQDSLGKWDLKENRVFLD